MDMLLYPSSSESTPNSELDQDLRSELRLLRLEASSPALRDIETYLPPSGSVRMEETDRSAIDFLGDWGGEEWTSQC